MKKILSIFLAILLAAGMMALSSCKDKSTDTKSTKSEDELISSFSVEVGDGTVVIRCDNVGDGLTIYDAMESLKSEGKLDFEFSSGMLTSLAGIENKADYSACWMLYTSDKEMSNDAWGTVEYEGETYASAVVGAETLPAKDGEIYIWLYQSMG